MKRSSTKVVKNSLSTKHVASKRPHIQDWRKGYSDFYNIEFFSKEFYKYRKYQNIYFPKISHEFFLRNLWIQNYLGLKF